MDHISFEIPGAPVPKARPRVTRRGGVYTPDRTVEHEEKIRIAWLGTFGSAARPMFPAGPVGLLIGFGMPRPKSHYGAKGLKDSAPIWHTGKPDVDNLVKTVKDALRGLAFRDDSQVARIWSAKAYQDEPQTHVEVFSLDDGQHTTLLPQGARSS